MQLLSTIPLFLFVALSTAVPYTERDASALAAPAPAPAPAPEAEASTDALPALWARDDNETKQNLTLWDHEDATSDNSTLETRSLVARDGGYYSTCSNFGSYLAGGSWQFQATCAGGTPGSSHTGALNLDYCIINGDGTMYAQNNGRFTPSCTGCTGSGSVFTCGCLKRDGSRWGTSIDLNNFITNANGVLCCFGHCGS